MADFELLAPGGHQKLVDEVEDRLDFKADIDGYYAQLTAGAADNLTGRGDTTTAEFLYRTAGGTADIETGQAVAKSVKGNTLVWNQLVNYGANTATTDGVTFTNNSDGSWTASGTATNNIYKYPHKNTNNLPSLYLTTGHVYLYKGCPTSGSGTTYMLRDGQNGNAADVGAGSIFTAVSTKLEFKPAIYVVNGTTIDNVVFRPQVFDLTQMFGAGNEPSTVAEFEALFPLPYYEYDAGSLLSVNMEGIETVGFNQWDEQTDEGIWNDNGTMSGSSAYICCKNKIPVFPGQTYYFQRPAAVTNVYMKGYDANGVNGISLSLPGTNLLTIPSGVYFITFAVAKSQYGTTYNNDICINLHWSGRRDGEYEPFWSSQREIAAVTYFPDGMRSAGTVRDELTATEAITRVGVVDLGTLEWQYGVDGSQNSIMYTVDSKIQNAAIAVTNVNVETTLATYSNIMFVRGGSQVIFRIYNTGYTDAAAFKAAVSGVMLYYELATPTVTPIDPALNLSYRVDDFGTERVMVPEDERSAPPVLDIAYGLNVVDFVRRAPSEYISAASFRQYLLARDAHDGTTTTMTWDDTDNRYEFAITDTVTEG